MSAKLQVPLIEFSYMKTDDVRVRERLRVLLQSCIIIGILYHIRLAEGGDM